MKLGERLIHNKTTVVLVSGTQCTDCYFNYTEANCPEEGLIKLCMSETDKDDDGIFIKLEEETRNE